MTDSPVLFNIVFFNYILLFVDYFIFFSYNRKKIVF